MGQAAKKVSILIANYNYGQFLEECINSALNQTYSNTEAIVVDDGSTDNSKQVLEKFKGNQKVKAIFKQHEGVSSTRNALLEAYYEVNWS